MASNAQESAKERLSHGLHNRTYGYVLSLIIYWKAGDQRFKVEGKKLGKFFKDRLGYAVKKFEIPHVDSHLHLVCFIAEAVKNTNRLMVTRNCPALIVLHYGGHGDYNDDRHSGEQGESVWAEQEKGGITIKWLQIQQHFQHAKSDLLLVLDCCFALRASQQQLTPQPEANPAASYQLLAAASHREPTPLPGERSFTNALLRRLQEHFPENDPSLDQPITTTQLIREIQNIKEPSLLIEPCHYAFTEGTILIGPITRSKNWETEREQYDGDTLTVKIRTRPNMTNWQIHRLIRHFTLDCPDFVERAELLDMHRSEASNGIDSAGSLQTRTSRQRSIESRQGSAELRRSARRSTRGGIELWKEVTKSRSRSRRSGVGNT